MSFKFEDLNEELFSRVKFEKRGRRLDAAMRA